MSLRSASMGSRALIVNDARRDASLTGTDAIVFIFDTYKDGQNGFVFGTNSIGIEYDAQIDNEGVRTFTSLDGLQQNRSIIIKYSYLFDVLRQALCALDDLRLRRGRKVQWNIRFLFLLFYWAVKLLVFLKIVV